MCSCLNLLRNGVFGHPGTGRIISFRARYYDLFSHIYDAFVRAHSRDPVESKRAFLAQQARVESVSTILDLCTGTGSSALRMAEENTSALVVGVDMSRGMLREARKKTPREANVRWVRADVCELPVATGSMDRVTCTYAMYELAGDKRERTLREARRVLKPGGLFVMIEHLPPERPVIRLLYLIRIYVLGTKGVRSFAGTEQEELARFFENVGTALAPGTKTKAVFGSKAEACEP